MCQRSRSISSSRHISISKWTATTCWPSWAIRYAIGALSMRQLISNLLASKIVVYPRYMHVRCCMLLFCCKCATIKEEDTDCAVDYTMRVRVRVVIIRANSHIREILYEIIVDSVSHIVIVAHRPLLSIWQNRCQNTWLCRGWLHKVVQNKKWFFSN